VEKVNNCKLINMRKQRMNKKQIFKQQQFQLNRRQAGLEQAGPGQARQGTNGMYGNLNYLVGKQCFICKGPFRNLRGMVVSANQNSIRVEI
jgi:hypothetical protein